MNKQVELIRAEIERKYKEAIEGVKHNQKKRFLDLRSNVNFTIWQYLESMLVHLLSFIDSLEEEPISTHDAVVKIPFGAKDSELQEARYYIPDGYHAEVIGNEVFIKKGVEPKSEDLKEEVKKFILSYILA